MGTSTGLDIVSRDEFARFRGKSIGLVCNQASIAGNLEHVIDLLLPHHQAGTLKVQSVMGPQHGLYGHTQDNMIEWEGKGHPDARTGMVIHSLYGENREPTDAMLDGVEELVVDLPDVGARYYTFIWTVALCLKACEARGIPVTVLDRPNPIGGTQVEGTLLRQGMESFVGLYPLPTRHGMTIAEAARHLASTYFPKAELAIVPMEGWSREMYFEQTGQPWAMPSPNMPTVETAVVYPGGCLMEATWLSEGRGTTRPFEIFGAPYVDAWELCDALRELGLPGTHFRPLQFEPTFNKHAKELCGGAFLHVTDRQAFEPVLTTVAIFQTLRRLYGAKFEWRPGPYEYEWEKEPIDILAGNDWLKRAVDDLEPLASIRERFQAECAEFAPERARSLLY
jgi:uncharacterized protein YbbC (DUF1343 family)